MARPKDTEQRISGREAEYLRYFWNEGSLTIRELTDLLPEPHPHVNTVATVLKSLETKVLYCVNPIHGQLATKLRLRPTHAAAELCRALSETFSTTHTPALYPPWWKMKN